MPRDADLYYEENIGKETETGVGEGLFLKYTCVTLKRILREPR